MKSLNDIQLTIGQLNAISAAIKVKAPCKLLIFGLGYDSLFWVKLNRGGLTIFLEDNQDWFRKITQTSKDILAFLIDYKTRRKDWKGFLDAPSLLDMNLPSPVGEVQWDVILVDGPEGHKDQTPGRMKSIYLSSKLIKPSGDVFVHDTDREIEDVFCNRFLKKENLKTEIKATVGFLRHYHIRST